MSKSQIEKFVEDSEGMRLFQQERLILAATERICEVMREKKINRKRLAEALGKSKSFVTQLLDGSRNMTLRTLSDVFLVLGYAVDVQTGSIEETVKSPIEMTVDVDDAVWDEQTEWNPDTSSLIVQQIEQGEFEDVAA